MKFESFSQQDSEPESKREAGHERPTTLPPSEITSKEKIMSLIKRWSAIGIVALSSFHVYSSLSERLEKLESDTAIDNNEWIAQEREHKEYEELNIQIGEQYPDLPFLLAYLQLADLDANKDERSDTTKTVVFEGFDKLPDGLNGKIFKEMWSDEYYPRGIVSHNVDTVRFVHNWSKHAQTEDISDIDTTTNLGYVTGLRDIVFLSELSVSHEEENYEKILAIDNVFSHELGHLIDWERGRDYSPIERRRLLLEVTRLFDEFSPDELEEFSYYVASLDDENFNSEDEKKYEKVEEFWAEAVEYYFTFPSWLEDDYPKVFLLVERWLTRNDPTFNVRASLDRKWYKFTDQGGGGVVPDYIPPVRQPNSQGDLSN